MYFRGLLLVALVGSTLAQIPYFGWCPDYKPMKGFNLRRFLGMWYEAERYINALELGSRCVASNYERKPDGRIWVSNEITAFTGVKRILEGQVQLTGKSGEGLMNVKYTSLPVAYDTKYSVLDTDYDNYAVIWSCNGLGPVHTQNAWVMTRTRNAPSSTMQAAYGVLDDLKITRSFFLKTNQNDCEILPLPEEAIDTPTTETADEEATPIILVGQKSGLNIDDESNILPDILAKPVAQLDAVVPIPAPSQEMQAPQPAEGDTEKTKKTSSVAELILAAAEYPTEDASKKN